MDPYETVVGGFFGPLQAILGPQGPSWALLEPSWAVLEACWAMLAAWMALLGRFGVFGEARGRTIAAHGPPKGGPIHAGRRGERGGWAPYKTTKTLSGQDLAFFHASTCQRHGGGYSLYWVPTGPRTACIGPM